MPKVISHPGTHKTESPENIIYQNQEQHFGYFEIQNAPARKEQEDALIWETLESALGSLSPEDIGKRLWTTYRSLDEQFLAKDLPSGCTASTTVYDRKGNLITATLGDAASFAAVYDKEGNVLEVVRLNSIAHKPGEESEKARILGAGGFVLGLKDPRVVGKTTTLAVSRSIGDKDYKTGSGVCSEASINTTNINELAAQFNIDPSTIGNVKIIITCDGFTDGTKIQTKKGHEEFLFACLKEIEMSGVQLETEISKRLVLKAKQNSKDNITVAIQTINKDTPAFMMGVYDGHGGVQAPIFMAENIGNEFKAQCKLSQKNYAEQKFSVDNNEKVYLRDNSKKEKIQTAQSNTNDVPQTLGERILYSERKRELKNKEQLKQAEGKLGHKVIICSDFDGTVTGRGGERTVNSEFYCSLLQANYLSYGEYYYKDTPMRDEQSMQQLFNDHFGFDWKNPKQDADLLMKPETVAFYKDMLNRYPAVDVYFVTRNRDEYIRALFKYQGFTAEEINRLKILDSDGKKVSTKALFQRITDNPSLYIFDDSPSDFNEMVNASQEHQDKFEKINSLQRPTGTFEWGKYHQEILNTLSEKRRE